MMFAGSYAGIPFGGGLSFENLLSQLPGGEQGPAQGYNTPVKFDSHMNMFVPMGRDEGYLPPSPDAMQLPMELAGVLPDPIDPAKHNQLKRQQKIYNKGKGTDNPNEADAFLRRTGPQLPKV
jgi:hypothetical protein